WAIIGTAGEPSSLAGSESAAAGAPVEAGRGDSASSAESVLTALERLPHPPSTAAAIRTRRTRRTESPPSMTQLDGQSYSTIALSIQRTISWNSGPARQNSSHRPAAAEFSRLVLSLRDS